MKSRASNTTVMRLLLLFAGALQAACSVETEPQRPDGADAADLQTGVVGAPPDHVGSGVCQECHQQQWQDWAGSQHDLALQQANAGTVLAEFEGVHGNATFSRDTDRFFIAPDTGAKLRPVVYTFGVEPLQQYIIEDRDGRLQTFPMPWDTRPAADGGQRFYELYPGDFPPGDPMHWTGQANNWNSMCADCHSTGVSKGYDPDTRTYQTRFAEEDVACEACHGPGSAHVSAVRSGAAADYPALQQQAQQINACAPCHSRRTQLAEGFTASASYFDHYLPALAREGLYFDDGQILDEVYVYGSFLQSRMHLAGVTCSDCHDPHTAELVLSGNALCTQCHNPQGRPDFPTLKPGDYDAVTHHRHPPETAAAACVNCHMDSRTYMAVDARRDHSFRIPRPDLSEQLNTPNACIGCHAEQSNEWAAAALADWFPPRPAHYGQAFAAARSGEPAAESALAGIIADDDEPIMVRATAVSLLRGYRRGYTLDSLRLAVAGPPLLRLGATEGAAGVSAQRRWQLLAPLLEDELLSVRSAAFSALLPLAAEAGYTERLREHLPAWLETQQLSRDFPATLVNVASAWSAFGEWQLAETNLDEALLLQPNYVPALLNLADLYRATLRDDQAGILLDRAMAAAPDSADAAYAYALWLTRQRQSTRALDYFRRAVELAPDDVRNGYTLAIALNDSGQSDAAIERLQAMQARWPDNDMILSALVMMLRDQGRFDEALGYLDTLLERNPADQQLLQLRAMLKGSAGG